MKTVVAFLLFGGLQLAAQDMQSCPMHKEHVNGASQHQAEVEKHGDEAMGFPHDKTTHHFRLHSDGGAIEVTVNDGKDSQNMQAIRCRRRIHIQSFAQDLSRLLALLTGANVLVAGLAVVESGESG